MASWCGRGLPGRRRDLRQAAPNGESVQLTNDPARNTGGVHTGYSSRIAYTQLAFSGTPFPGIRDRSGARGQPTRLLPNPRASLGSGSQRVLFSEITTGLHMGSVTATKPGGYERSISGARVNGALLLRVANLKSILRRRDGQHSRIDSPCRLVAVDGSSAGRYVGLRHLLVSGLVTRRK